MGKRIGAASVPSSPNYDGLADIYAQYRMVHPEVLRDVMVSSMLLPTSRVLEVGCGTGNYIVAIRSIVGCECWGLDPSFKMLEEARRRRQAVILQQGCAESLHFAAGTFDLVFSVDVVHHVEDAQRYVAEAHRVLKPGRKLCTVTDSEWIIRNRQPLSNYFPDLVDIDLSRYPRMEALRAWMAEAGFGGITEHVVEFTDDLIDISEYRERAYSALHLLSDAAFQRGIACMEDDLRQGPIQRISRYVLVWGTKG
jgi:ubiquinone/menaquinone biosynthesis C-methylase UbiE